ncbi:MAG: beta-propeller domain-containing protein [Oscillospiraceae bacterium]|jgi:uncharacterized secreted protein with C-terminal beta-propeller domain|nr:beta-propeller domain-containing protein [Oscillospiraceae bacterium]
MKKTSLFKTIACVLALCLVFPLLSACQIWPAGPVVDKAVTEGQNTEAKTAAGQNPVATGVAYTGGASSSELYLHVGSPIALSDGKILPLDKENPGIVAMVHMNRTLVPLRFVSEFFGADVSYDDGTRTGVVEVGGFKAEFPVGENYFVLDGKQIPLDTQTLVTGGRIMLPLRALCEQVLGLAVDYSNGLIQIAKTTSITKATEKDVKSKIGMYVKASKLDSLESYLAEYGYGRYYDTYAVDNEMSDGAWEATSQPEPGANMANANDVPMQEPSSPARAPGALSGASADQAAPDAQPMPTQPPASAAASAPPPSMPQASESPESFSEKDTAEAALTETGGAGGADHSSTNTQVEGIDEGDVIKTDGQYIYLLCSGSISIVSALGEMTEVAKIDIGDINLSDMYIDDGRLIVIGSRWLNQSAAYIEPAPNAPSAKIATLPYRGVGLSSVYVYDTGDMSDVRLLRSFDVEGDIVTTRKQDGFLYFLTSMYYRYGDDVDPRPFAGENGDICPIPIEDIMIAPGYYADGFLTLSAINIVDTEDEVSSETITAGGYATTQYMSNSAMYIATDDYMNDGNGVSLAKFAINDGRIGYAGSGSVKGGLNDQFSMDEYAGHLRVATTNWDMTSKNNLFVLDGNMQICGSVQGFAPGERIYSARFMGERGYIVTFRETDPLFVFDLSDPTNPKVTGELKVPGFSSYLHPVGENTILGIGRDVYDVYMRDNNGKETVVGQRTGGIKLSLFDVSDMGKPEEIDTLILGNDGYAELLYNHKAAMFKANDGVLAFCANIFDNSIGDGGFSGAFVISYAGNILSERGHIESAQMRDYSYGKYNDNYGNGFYGERLVYIGNTLYYAENGIIRSFDLNTLKLTQSLTLR